MGATRFSRFWEARGGSGGAAGSRGAGAGGRAGGGALCEATTRARAAARLPKVLSVRSEPALMGLLSNFLGTARCPIFSRWMGVQGA